MSQWIDIYTLVNERNELLLLEFINTYIDLNINNDLEDTDLMILPLNANNPDELLNINDWDWEPAISITHSIKRGLDFPRRSYALYLNPNNTEVLRIIIQFTTDDKMIVGISIDETKDTKYDYKNARNKLNDLMIKFNSNKGFFGIEVAPPQNELEFINVMNSNLAFEKISHL